MSSIVSCGTIFAAACGGMFGWVLGLVFERPLTGAIVGALAMGLLFYLYGNSGFGGGSGGGCGGGCGGCGGGCGGCGGD